MSSEPVPTAERIQSLLDDLMARDLVEEKISFGRWSGARIVADGDHFVIMKFVDTNAAYVEKLLSAKSLDDAVQIQSEYFKSAYEGFVAQATKIGELYTNLAKEALKPVESVFAKVQGAAARGSGVDSSEDKSVDAPAMLDAAAQSLARSAELLTKAAEERGAVVTELAARGHRIDRMQKETRVLLDALVAGHD